MEEKSLVRMYVELAQKILAADDVASACAMAEAATPAASVVLPQDWHMLKATLVTERRMAGRMPDAWCPVVVAHAADLQRYRQQKQQQQQWQRRTRDPPAIAARRRSAFGAWCAAMSKAAEERAQAHQQQQQQSQQQLGQEGYDSDEESAGGDGADSEDAGYAGEEEQLDADAQA